MNDAVLPPEFSLVGKDQCFRCLDASLQWEHSAHFSYADICMQYEVKTKTENVCSLEILDLLVGP